MNIYAVLTHVMRTFIGRSVTTFTARIAGLTEPRCIAGHAYATVNYSLQNKGLISESFEMKCG